MLFHGNLHRSRRSNSLDSGGRFHQFCPPTPPDPIFHHMTSLTRTSLSLALALAAVTGYAQDAAKKPDAKPAAKWEAMDYGRFLSASIDCLSGLNTNIKN